LRFIDLYAGVGGFRLGMEKQGHECVWSCEIDEWCRKVYRYHWEEPEGRDIREVEPKEIPDFDTLCAGFPCQSFSLAGERKGFEDTRGTLFHEICRVARAKEPPHLFLENVKGLLSTQDREAFRIVLESLDGLGYNVSWQVLNSKNFGVPQNRPRVFIIGHLREAGGSPWEILPVGGGEGEDYESNEGERRGENRGEPVMVDFDSITPRSTSNCLQSSYKKGLPNSQGRMGVVEKLVDAGFQKSVYGPSGVSPIQKSLDWREDGTLREFDEISPTVRRNMGDNLLMALEHRGRTDKVPQICNLIPSLRSESHGHQPKVLHTSFPDGLREYEGESPAVQTPVGGGHLPRVLENTEELVFVGGLEEYRRLEDGESYSRNFRQGGRIYSSRGISPALSANSVGGVGGETGLFMIPHSKTKLPFMGTAPKPKGEGETSFPLSASGPYKLARRVGKSAREAEKGDDEDIYAGYVDIRKLTPVECERLQGFPDGWTEVGLTGDGEEVEISDTQRYKMMGNAVTVNVVEFIAERFNKAIEGGRL